jgi:hypothetical protein
VHGSATDSGSPLYPAIALPVRGKGSFRLPAWQQQQLRTDLARATRFLFVGWRGADEHFMRMLREYARKRRPIDVVCGRSSSALARRLQDALGSRSIAIKTGERFSDYLDDPSLLQDLLRRRLGGTHRRRRRPVRTPIPRAAS